MAALDIVQFPYGSDNYGVLLHNPGTGETACVDAGDARAAQQALTEQGWTLTQVWITHHHGDHTAGLAELTSSSECCVYGPADSAAQIGDIDVPLREGDTFEFAGRTVEILHTPGHTLDMLNFHLPEEALVFTGDTLFALGCGRLFEGDATTMWRSLQKLMALPAQTTVYCSHEYTAANADFAMTIDPQNPELVSRVEEIRRLRGNGQPTVPTTLATELATNPFLRAADPKLREHLGLADAPDAEVFAEVRRRKDNF